MKQVITLFLLVSLFACQSPKESEKVSEAGLTQASDYDPEAKLAEAGIELRMPSAPVANYVNSVRTGNLVFMAGKGPTKPEGG